MIAELYSLGWHLKHICDVEGMPEQKDTIWSWRNKIPEFDKQMDEAFKRKVLRSAEEIDEIADDGTNDYVEKEIQLKNGDTRSMVVFDHEHVQRSKLRIDTKQWALSHLFKALYGNKDAIGDDTSVEERGRQLRESMKEMNKRTGDLDADSEETK